MKFQFEGKEVDTLTCDPETFYRLMNVLPKKIQRKVDKEVRDQLKNMMGEDKLKIFEELVNENLCNPMVSNISVVQDGSKVRISIKKSVDGEEMSLKDLLNLKNN